MAQQTKKTSILNWQTLSGAGALVAGGIFALYAFGLGSPLSANNQAPQNLTTQGVQNRVQYLNSLEIKGEKGSVTFGYAEKNKVPMLVATGTLNLDNLVVGSTNTTVPTSVVFGGIDNMNSGSSSVIVVGSGNRIAPNAQNAILVSSKRSSVNAQNVVVLNGENSNIEGSIEGRKNIAAFGKNNQVNGSFLTVMGDNNTVKGDHIVAIGGNVDAAKSNIFVFNTATGGQFTPAHESAFYANSKVAINTESSPAQLTIAGGLKIKIAEKTDLSLSGDHRGVIATFSDGAHTGLCGRDGEERGDSDRVPLSEAAREFGLCAGAREAVDIPSPSTTIISQTGVVNGKVDLPRQWIVNDSNPDGKRYPWQWRYGSDKLPGYFLCAENHIPDREGNILGRTGVKCIPCENGTAKPGDLNCTPNQEETVEQPKELTCSVNQHIENGVCVANTKQVACNPAGIDKTNGSFTNAMVTVTWNNGAWSQPATCQLSCNPTYTPAKKSASSLHNDYCAKLEENIRVRFMFPNEEQYINAFTKIAMQNVSENGPQLVSTALKYTNEQETFKANIAGLDIPQRTPYLELQGTKPGTLSNFIIKVLDETYGSWGWLEASVERYDILGAENKNIARGWNMEACHQDVAFCGVDPYSKGQLRINDLLSEEDKDIVYYFSTAKDRDSGDGNQTNDGIRMKKMNYLYSDGNHCGDKIASTHQQQPYHRGFYRPLESFRYSNHMDFWCAHYASQSKESVQIYIKEQNRGFYFYKDANFSQKADNWIYDLNPTYPGWSSTSASRLINELGIVGVRTYNGKVIDWIGTKNSLSTNFDYNR